MPCHDLDPARAEGGVPADEPDALSQQPPHIAFTPLIRAFAREIAGEERNPLLLARRVYDAPDHLAHLQLPAQLLHLPQPGGSIC